MYQTEFNSEEFAGRRKRILEAIGNDAVALIQGGPKEEGHDLFRQTNDIYYLSGVEVPHAYLLIDGRNNLSHLFLPHQSQERREKEGEELSPENADVARDLTGVDGGHGIEGLGRFLERSKVIYTPLRKADYATSWDSLQRLSVN